MKTAGGNKSEILNYIEDILKYSLKTCRTTEPVSIKLGSKRPCFGLREVISAYMKDHILFLGR